MNGFKTISWEELIIGDTFVYDYKGHRDKSFSERYELILKVEENVVTTLNCCATDRNKMDRWRFSAYTIGCNLATGEYKNFRVVRDDEVFSPVPHQADLDAWKKSEDDAKRAREENARDLVKNLDKLKIVQDRLINNPDAEVSDAQIWEEWILMGKCGLPLVVVLPWHAKYGSRLVEIANNLQQAQPQE